MRVNGFLRRGILKVSGFPQQRVITNSANTLNKSCQTHSRDRKALIGKHHKILIHEEVRNDFKQFRDELLRECILNHIHIHFAQQLVQERVPLPLYELHQPKK